MAEPIKNEMVKTEALDEPNETDKVMTQNQCEQSITRPSTGHKIILTMALTCVKGHSLLGAWLTRLLSLPALLSLSSAFYISSMILTTISET